MKFFLSRIWLLFKRNEWMVKKSDFAVTYIKHRIGGAHRYAEAMKKKGQTVINLADM